VATLLESLRRHAAVRQATIFGQSIHALVDRWASETDLGLRDAKVLESEPSLEDVFVSLSRAQGMQTSA
jgi:hypothetical protein